MNEVLITRVFAAPRAKVWRAWTEPELYKQWWGPRGFTSPVCRIDLRVGGRYVNSMLSPDGQEYWGTGEFREIIPEERLIMTDSYANAEGKAVSAAHYGMAGDWPEQLLVMLSFEDDPAGTKLTLRHEGLPDQAAADQDRTGWNESFDKLDNVLRQL